MKTEDWERDLTGKLAVFVDTWKGFQGTEQGGAQSFMGSLLEIYGASFRPGTVFEQHPIKVLAAPGKAKARANRQGALFGADDAPVYTTERMDMYLPKVCVWEMKAPSEKDLGKHHDQLLRYWSRMRTRYLVLCNFHEFWIYDTDEDGGQLEPKLRFSLAELPSRGDALLFLRGDAPDLSTRSERITADVASALGRLTRELGRAAGDAPRDRERIAKFILECVFAMFAEDTELVPPKLFTNVLRDAAEAGRMDAVWSLFDDFARHDAADKGNRFAPYVNGPLFDQKHPKLALSDAQIQDLYKAARDFDWQDVRPEIFGSIFEQALDPALRHELGAHFTREDDIARVVGPTIIEPWRERISAIRTQKDAERVVAEMKAFHVLDPACGCGNFLYVVYREMKRLEAALVATWNNIQRKVQKRRADFRPAPPLPYFTLEQLHGIEKEPFAAFLARVVLWIGEHLARVELALDEETLPLKNLDANVRQADALFTPWPRPEGELAIVGNPPYLGVRKLRKELGDEYVERLFEAFPNNRAADFVTYWFPKALQALRPGERAGFVCTNSIGQNESREASIDPVLAAGGTLTDAWRSYPWPGEAAVHVAIVNWVMAPYDGIKQLDGHEAMSISPGLTESIDVSRARTILMNRRLCFMGVTPGNHGFVLDAEERTALIAADPASAAVVKPFLVGRDVNREVDQKATRWIVDFALMDRAEAEAHRGAFRHVQRRVYSEKHSDSHRKTGGELSRWWQFVRPRPDLRSAIAGMRTVIAIPCVSPHLIVTRQPAPTCFDHQLMVLPLSTAYHFGLLQSRLHELWARARGSTLKGDLRYTNTTVFETFPFPPLPRGKYDPRLVPGSTATSRLEAAANAFEKARAAACKKHDLGLTKIHNLLKAGELPELGAAYDAMNDAAAACYGFPEDVWRDERETLRRLLELNDRLAPPAAAGAKPVAAEVEDEDEGGEEE